MKPEEWHGYFHQLRLEKEATLQGEEELVAPEPEHTSRDPWPDGFAVPSGAAGLIKSAEAAGWLTEVRYARGSVVTRKKELGRVVERRHSVAVRLWHPGAGFHAVAVWEATVEAEKLAWKADVVRVWRAGEVPVEAGVTFVKACVKATVEEVQR